MGFETDSEIGRAWLHGPFVDRSSSTWNPVADALYAKAQAAIPIEIVEHELCIGVRNRRVGAFGKRHGVVPFSHSISLSVRRSDRVHFDVPPDGVRPLDPTHYEEFPVLHEQLFPHTYYTGRQILERINETSQVFAVEKDHHLLGQLVVRVSPEIGTGCVEFVGVSEPLRRRGIGSDLIARGLEWAFHHPTINEISLTVSASNAAALSLYERYGFRRGREIIGLRCACGSDRGSGPAS